MGFQTHKAVDKRLCQKCISHAEKELLGWLHLERDTPQLMLADNLKPLVQKVDSLKGKYSHDSVMTAFKPMLFPLDFYDPRIHGHPTNLVTGVRSVIDAKGHFVTSKKTEAEEEDQILEGPSGNQLEFDHLEVDNDPVDSGDESEAESEDMDTLLEYLADEE